MGRLHFVKPQPWSGSSPSCSGPQPRHIHALITLHFPPPAPLWPLAQLPGSAGKGLLIHHRGNAAGLPPRRLGLRVKELRLLRQGRIKDSYFAHPHTNPPTLYVFDHFSPAPRLIRRDHPPPHPTSLHIRIMWRESEGCGCKEAALSPFLSHCV